MASSSWAPLLVFLLVACPHLHRLQVAAANANGGDGGNERPTAENLTRLVATTLLAAQGDAEKVKVLAAINGKNPKYSFDGFYATVYYKGVRVAHTDTTTLGLTPEQAAIATQSIYIPNWGKQSLALAAAGGGWIEYPQKTSTGSFALKKSLYYPIAPKEDSYVVAGYITVPEVSYGSYSPGSPVVAQALGHSFALRLAVADNVQTLTDAVNKQVYPGTIPGGFYVTFYVPQGSDYLTVAHGAVFAKANKTLKDAETPAVAQALTNAFNSGLDQWVFYNLDNKQNKWAWAEKTYNVKTGQVYYVLSGYLPPSSA